LLLVLSMGAPSGVFAQQAISNCDESLSQEILDANNVRTRVYNNGALFWKGGQNLYEVPKGSGVNALFAGNIWIAGTVDGQLRSAQSTYGPYEFWAGPLDENGAPPADCSAFDEMYNVRRTDVLAYEASGATTPDLANWPTGLGAPTLDADGNLIPFNRDAPLADRVARVIDLEAGERPAITGDQTIWWVMNDLGNQHLWSESEPVGLEVHGEAFSFNLDGPVGNMTFYRYRIYYKGDVPLEDTYMGIWSDPDLGDASDDYIGSDSLLGLGYVYNGDNDDAGNYGVAPPAVGYDFFQGPIVPSVGDTAFQSGVAVPDFRNLGTTYVGFFDNGGGVQGDPTNGREAYAYLRGRWPNEQRFTFGGTGLDFSNIPVNFVFPGDPETGIGWTEGNPAADGSLAANPPADRRFFMSTGPITMMPGDFQEVVYGIVYARGTSDVNSVTELKKADGLAQSAFDVNFNLPTPPQAPSVAATALDGQVILTWENPPTSNNYLEAYEEFDPLALDPFASVEDRTYFFEGYEVIRYADATDQVGQVIAVYDQPNGVQQVIDLIPGETELNQEVFSGQDLGVQTFHVEEQLTNYTTAYFGVRAIAYNELSLPKIFRSPVSRLEVVPARSDVDLAATALEASASGDEPDILAAGQGDGVVFADVVNPAEVTGSAYTIDFRSEVIGTTDDAGKRAGVELDPNREPEVDELLPTIENANKLDDILGLTYSISRDGSVIFDPWNEAGALAPFREGVVVLDGLSFSVTNPPFDFKGFAAIQNAAGPIEPWDMASYAFNGWGFPQLELTGLTPPGSYPSSDRPTRGVQQSLSNDVWGFHVGSGAGPYAEDGSGVSYIERTFTGRGRTVEQSIGSNDFEMRFTQECIDNAGSCQGWRRFNDDVVINVPFEIWNLGPDPSDPSDDFRMIPAVLDLTVVGQSAITSIDVYDIGGDHAVSGGVDDPFTDWVYWFEPADLSPGTVGYDAFFGNTPGNASPDLGGERIARSVLVLWNGGEEGVDDAEFAGKLPEPGTVFRLTSNKPIVAGDVFMMSSAGFEPSAKSQATLAEELGEVSIVPNPYKGASTFERSQLVDEARITNLPQEATIRVFTLSGSLIRTIEKSSPERHLVWNMTTDNNLPIASGLYLIHVETDAGSTVVKFAVVRKRTELNNF